GAGIFLTIPTEGGIGIPLIGFSIGVPPIGVIPNADSNAAATSANSFDLPVPGAPVSKTFFERARRFKTRKQSVEKLAAIAIYSTIHKIKKTNNRLIYPAWCINT
ncbi:hypothetical protein ACOIC8_27830, partial [Klebsiella pneumoniae]|uniref:hypothetical protein n=1 Tax=Klebsiella pneumoniae TaxID=573 RepID=UPI003B5C82A1